jgi:hypothetical protein
VLDRAKVLVGKCISEARAALATVSNREAPLDRVLDAHGHSPLEDQADAAGRKALVRVMAGYLDEQGIAASAGSDEAVAKDVRVGGSLGVATPNGMPLSATLSGGDQVSHNWNDSFQTRSDANYREADRIERDAHAQVSQEFEALHGTDYVNDPIYQTKFADRQAELMQQKIQALYEFQGVHRRRHGFV